MPNDSVQTLAEAMAIAVLKGERHTAYALADRLIEERAGNLAEQCITYRDAHRTAVEGFEVYSWPEFQALCTRLGVLWDLNTISMTITFKVGEVVVIDQQYQAATPTGHIDPVI